MTGKEKTRREVLATASAVGVGGALLSSRWSSIGSANPTEDASERLARERSTVRDREWPMFGQNLVNSGRTTDPAPKDGVEQGWSTSVTTTTDPIVYDGSVYVGTSEGVKKVDTGSGEVVWTASTDSAVSATPGAGERYVYAGTEDGRIYAFGQQDANEKWRFEATDSVQSAIAADAGNGYVYAADAAGMLWKFEALSGNEKWEFDAGGDIDTDIAVSTDRKNVYLAGPGAQVIAVDLDVGRERWTQYLRDDLVTALSVSRSGCFVGDASGTVHEIDPSMGDEQWSYSLDGQIAAAPTFDEEVAYVGTDDGSVHALDSEFVRSEDVEEKWKVDVGAAVTRPPVMSGEKNALYVCSEDGKVTCLSIDSGDELWSAQLTAGNAGLALADGSVYVAGDSLTVLDSGSKTEITTTTPTPTPTPTDTPTSAETSTRTPTDTPTATDTPTPTATPTSTGTPSPTRTETPTPTDTMTDTPTPTPTETLMTTDTPTDTPTTSGSGPLAPLTALVGIGGLTAYGLYRREDDDPDE